MRLERLASRYRSGAILVAFFVVLSSGCSSDRRLGVRSERAGQGSATIAKDRNSFPAGQVIPPAGLGVDLVRANGGGEPPRGEVGLAGFTHNGVPGQNP
ncbi:hypothetical protein V5E97_00865 [Singulisphaera sp. Ch08]|uniref:Uncharacterized protein n=1 Tax=Singulisphaera sp. Ch08 TaxID=3120278 RepID=A0AAU7CHM7_9BACT